MYLTSLFLCRVVTLHIVRKFAMRKNLKLVAHLWSQGKPLPYPEDTQLEQGLGARRFWNSNLLSTWLSSTCEGEWFTVTLEWRRSCHLLQLWALVVIILQALAGIQKAVLRCLLGFFLYPFTRRFYQAISQTFWKSFPSQKLFRGLHRKKQFDKHKPKSYGIVAQLLLILTKFYNWDNNEYVNI